jgi:hypothetical protein
MTVANTPSSIRTSRWLREADVCAMTTDITVTTAPAAPQNRDHAAATLERQLQSP